MTSPSLRQPIRKSMQEIKRSKTASERKAEEEERCHMVMCAICGVSEMANYPCYSTHLPFLIQ